MSLGTQLPIADGDLMQGSGGAFRPANFVLLGTYVFTGLQTFNTGVTIANNSTLTLNSGSKIVENDTTDATAAATGSIQTLGGVYVAKSIFTTAAQTIDLGTGTRPTPISVVNCQFYNLDDVAPGLEFTSWKTTAATTGASVRTRVAGGTRASVGATVDNIGLLSLNCGGHDGSAYVTQAAILQATSDGLWSGSNRGAYWKFQGTTNGSTSIAEWLRLYRSQIIQLNSVAPTANTFAGNILFGCNNATAVTAGQVGEVISSTVSGAAVAGTGTAGNITSISLTAGVWAIGGFAVYAGGATGLTVNSTAKLSIVTTTATNGTSGSTMTQESVLALLANGLFAISINNIAPVSPTSTTTYYLTEEVTYAAGSPTASATIFAIRIR